MDHRAERDEEEQDQHVADLANPGVNTEQNNARADYRATNVRCVDEDLRTLLGIPTGTVTIRIVQNRIDSYADRTPLVTHQDYGRPRLLTPDERLGRFLGGLEPRSKYQCTDYWLANGQLVRVD